MTEKEKENRIRWYYEVVVNKRIRSRYLKRVLTCYIFSSSIERDRFIEKYGIRPNRHVFMLTEGQNVCLVGTKIKEVNLISSRMPEVVEEICKRAINDGYELIFNNYMDKRY